MRHTQIIRELRRQARQLNLAADILDGKPQPVKTSKPIERHSVIQPNLRPTLSAAARRKISIAQKKRWALHRGGLKKAA